MPYIKGVDKISLALLNAPGRSPQNSGELNYVITSIIQDYFVDNGGRYQQINDIIGALEGAKLEFTRRITNPYEDSKIKENGDVVHINLNLRGLTNGY